MHEQRPDADDFGCLDRAQDGIAQQVLAQSGALLFAVHRQPR